MAWYGSELSEMTLNYWRLVERYPRSNGVVGNLIPSCEIFSLLDKKTSQGSMPLVFLYMYISIGSEFINKRRIE